MIDKLFFTRSNWEVVLTAVDTTEKQTFKKRESVRMSTILSLYTFTYIDSGPAPEQSTWGDQSLKLSTKTAVFKKEAC